MATVGEAVQGGPGQPFAAEYFRPVFERKIGGYNQTLSLVGRADHVEQQLRSDLAGRHVAEFIQNQQIEF